MLRINSDGSVGGLFQDGSDLAGIEGTIVTAEWLDNVQEELCAPIDAAQIGLNGNDRTQLLQALRSMFVWNNTVPTGANRLKIAWDSINLVATVDVTVLGGLALQPWVLAQVLAEAAARLAADQAERDARIAADVTEASARVAGDQTERDARIAADVAEGLLRSNADQAELAARIAADVAEAAARVSGDQTERDARIAADVDEALLRSNADQAELTARIAADLAEAGARDAADVTEAGARLAGDQAERDARIAADTAEALLRLTGDQTERDARIGADVTEANARIAGDATERAYADAVFPPFTAFGESIGSNGFKMLPGSVLGGIQTMMQWGRGVTSSGYGDVVPFASPFPHNALAVIVCEAEALGWGDPPVTSTYGASLNGPNSFKVSNVRGGNYVGGFTFNYIAIGY